MPRANDASATAAKKDDPTRGSAPAWQPPANSDYEKLGLFYLGRPYDLEAKTPRPGLILYDSKDLVTHAVTGGAAVCHRRPRVRRRRPRPDHRLNRGPGGRDPR